MTRRLAAIVVLLALGLAGLAWLVTELSFRWLGNPQPAYGCCSACDREAAHRHLLDETEVAYFDLVTNLPYG